MMTHPCNPHITLLGARTNNCMRVAIALEEAAVPYTVRRIDMRNGEHKKAEYLALNPAGQVPVMILQTEGQEDFVLSQSNAIMFFASEQARNPLLPSDGPDRARALERLFYFLGDVIGPSHNGVFLRVGGELAGAAVLMERALSMLVQGERFVTDSPYIAGDQFTLADIAAVTFATEASQLVDWDSVPRLRTWMDRIAARSAVQRGFLAFG